LPGSAAEKAAIEQEKADAKAAKEAERAERAAARAPDTPIESVTKSVTRPPSPSNGPPSRKPESPAVLGQNVGGSRKKKKLVKV